MRSNYVEKLEEETFFLLPPSPPRNTTIHFCVPLVLDFL